MLRFHCVANTIALIQIAPATGKRGTQGSYDQQGKIERINDTTVRITELPVRTWTQTYKEWLESLVTGSGDGKESKAPILKDFKENHTETTVDFTIEADKKILDEFETAKGGLLAKFKLTGSMATSNMTLFDKHGRLSRYDTTTDILNYFFPIRLEYYGKRKDMLVSKLEIEQRKLSNKARFVEEVCSGDLVVSNRKRAVILADLQERNYELFDGKSKNDIADSEDEASTVDESPTDAELAKGYEYLLGMKIWSLTLEKAQELRQKLEEKTQELEALKAMEPTDLWLNDLEDIEIALDERDANLDQAAKDEVKAKEKNQKRRAKKKPAGRKKKDQWDSDEEEDSEMEKDPSSSDESDGGFAIAKKARKPLARKVVTAKPSLTKSAPAKPVVKKQLAPPKTSKPAPATKKPAVPAKEFSDSSDSDTDIGTSLTARLQKKVYVSPKGKKLAAAGAAKARAGNSAITLDFNATKSGDSLNSLNATNFDKATLTPAVNKKKRASKKSVLQKASESDDLEFHSDEEPLPPPKPAASRRAGRTTKKPVYVDSDSEVELSASDSDF